ncbi:MAG: 4Fe-4S binding protein [Desulfovibrionaceae bacterium]
MREIVIISGKGGAGKTSVTGAFAHLAQNAVVADLDVDAPDLHLLLAPEPYVTEPFVSGNEAVIDPERCAACGVCAEACRFEAVIPGEDAYSIDPVRCEGCKTCVVLCPENAIAFPARTCGEWFLSETRFGPMAHARLFPGEENSGKLVTEIKRRARDLAEERGLSLVLADGAPGIGCPVISSLSGTDLAVVVTEPTVSGRHDLERVADLCAHFRVPVAVFINKFVLNREQTSGIEAWCEERGIPVVCRLPHHKGVTKAMLRGKVVTEYDPLALGEPLAAAWKRIVDLANKH